MQGLATPGSTQTATWKCAIYLRLSVKDNNRNPNESIATQEQVVRDALKDEPDLAVVKSYTDNGYTGTEFAHRPAFLQMMTDIRKKEINCVAVKDLSRLGRNYLETGFYLQRILPVMGVRFISVTDNLDSLRTNDQSEELLIPIKNLLNEMHSRELARKNHAAYLLRAAAGTQGIRQAAYGYRKKPEDNTRLEPDPAKARVVKQIFRGCYLGFNSSKIARRLNDLGCTAPSGAIWDDASVRRILRNPVYKGDLVFNVIDAGIYSPQRFSPRPASELIVHHKAHKAIVSAPIYEKVQQQLDRRSTEKRKRQEANAKARELMPDLFADVGVWCACCGRRMKFDRGLAHAQTRGAVYYCTGPIRRTSCPTRPRVAELVVRTLVGDEVRFALTGSRGGSGAQLSRKLVKAMVARVEVAGDADVRVQLRPPFAEEAPDKETP